MSEVVCLLLDILGSYMCSLSLHHFEKTGGNMRLKILTSSIALFLLGAVLYGCGGTTNTNTNNTRSNVTNLGANNANTGAIVVNANTNRWANTTSTTPAPLA